MSLTASAAASGYPRYADIGIITLAPDKWGDLWMGRHQIAARLTEHFHGVWMNPPHHWRHTGRRFFDRSETVSQPHGTRNLLVYQPEAWLPRISRDGRLSRLLWRARIDRAKNILRSRGCRRFVLYLWRPRFANAASAAAVDLVCYHIADEYSFSDEEVPITPREAALIAEADRVFVVSEALMNKKGHINPATFLVPNGVDFDAYSSDAPEPTDLRVIPRPRVGYTGYLKKQLDWELLEHLAESHPEWSFVFVGQTSPDPTFDDALRRLREVDLEPGIALANMTGTRSPRALVEPRAQPRPRDQVMVRREAGHIEAHFRDDHRGDDGTDARDGRQSVDSLSKGFDPLSKPPIDGLDRALDRVDLIKMESK